MRRDGPDDVRRLSMVLRHEEPDPTALRRKVHLEAARLVLGAVRYGGERSGGRETGTAQTGQAGPIDRAPSRAPDASRRALLDLDAGELDHLAPLFDGLREDGPEFRRRAPERRAAEF